MTKTKTILAIALMLAGAALPAAAFDQRAKGSQQPKPAYTGDFAAPSPTTAECLLRDHSVGCID